LAFSDNQPAYIRNQCGNTNQQCVFCIPAHIEVIAGYQKPDIPYFSRDNKIHQNHNRKKYQKIQGIE
jgi:hypothetical protein